MIGGTFFLQTFVYSGGGIGGLLDSLAQMGFFSFVLPFLLIFALVYGLLMRVKLFDQQGINAVIALSVSLMAIQFDFVPLFFSQIFPRVGIGLAILLAILIIVGIFLPKQTWIIYALFAVSLLVIILILVNTATSLGLDYGSGAEAWLVNNWPILFGLAFVGMVAYLITDSKKSVPTPMATIASRAVEKLFS